MSARISLAMSQALDLLRAGHPPRIAASRAGVNLTALYRAMRREGVGERCPTCGAITRLGRAPRQGT